MHTRHTGAQFVNASILVWSCWQWGRRVSTFSLQANVDTYTCSYRYSLYMVSLLLQPVMPCRMHTRHTGAQMTFVSFLGPQVRSSALNSSCSVAAPFNSKITP